MTVLPFTAHCGRGHDDVTFTDRDSFDEHCKAVHKTRRLGTPELKARPFKAPAVPKDAAAALARLLASSPDVEVLDDSAVELGHYTNSEPFAAQHKVVSTEVPVDALPPAVASIVSATAARGEVFLVTLKADGDAFVQLATELSADSMNATIRLAGGKVRSVESRGVGDDGGYRYSRTVTMTQVREAFGPKAVRVPKLELVAA